VQGLFVRWATYTGEATGQQLFDDMFHRFFYIHELSHWLQRQVKGDSRGAYRLELEANRITVAYWREKDIAYMTAMLARFQRLGERLPSPVPDGQDPEQYFNENRRMGSNPNAYGWFQTRMVIEAGAERPIRTFSGILRDLYVDAQNPVR
jgi:hypothetical protein